MYCISICLSMCIRIRMRICTHICIRIRKCLCRYMTRNRSWNRNRSRNRNCNQINYRNRTVFKFSGSATLVILSISNRLKLPNPRVFKYFCIAFVYNFLCSSTLKSGLRKTFFLLLPVSGLQGSQFLAENLRLLSDFHGNVKACRFKYVGR